jgi:shikimate dehydrogenase
MTAAAPFYRLALLGHPVGHSRSPEIHNGWLKTYDLHGTYTAIDCLPAELSTTVGRLIAEDYTGFNVTLPHKQAIVDLCDTVDDLARAAGAVNTVHIKDGALHGTNTDVFGFIENIRCAAPDFDFTAAPAVVLGAGGAARAVVQGLCAAGTPRIILTNRTLDKATQIKGSCTDPARVQAVPWAARSDFLSTAGLLVNTTSLGMAGHTDLDVDLTTLPAHALVTDIVYVPLMTALLTTAHNRGNPIVTGEGMLVHQARKSFELWTGVLPAG